MEAPNRRGIDPFRTGVDNSLMSTTSPPTTKDLEEAISQEPDRETMRKACEEMDRLREETRRRIGIVDVAVEFVRDARDP